MELGPFNAAGPVFSMGLATTGLTTGYTSRTEVEANAAAFQALSASEVYVLQTDGNLWLESAPFGTIPPPGRSQVDGSVYSFNAIDASDVLVLGTDAKLWWEYGPYTSVPPRRLQVDGNVMY